MQRVINAIANTAIPVNNSIWIISRIILMVSSVYVIYSGLSNGIPFLVFLGFLTILVTMKGR